MPNPTPADIRHIFLNPRRQFALLTAAQLLGISLGELKKDIADGGIVAISTGVGLRVPREEMIAAAMERWDQAMIEEALGDDAAAVLPEAVRLVELRARVPRYQRDVVAAVARAEGISRDQVLSRELEDFACAYAERLGGAVPTLRVGLRWPGAVD